MLFADKNFCDADEQHKHCTQLVFLPNALPPFVDKKLAILIGQFSIVIHDQQENV